MKNQSGQAMIEACLSLTILVILIKFIFWGGYALYTSVITQYITYEMAICRSQPLKHRTCLFSYREKTYQLLPFGELQTFKTHENTQNKTVNSRLRFRINIPLLSTPVIFDKKVSLTFPLTQGAK